MTDFSCSLPIMIAKGAGQRRKLGRAIPVHDDQPGDIPVGFSQIEACVFQLRTQQGALVLQHFGVGGHA